MKPKNIFPFSYLLFLLLLSFTCFSPTFCLANDTITSEIFIKDPASLISSSSSFQLGFFTPPNSTTRYVGIWYINIPSHTIVWVANRENPLKDASGIFTISMDGNLVVLDGDHTVLWSSNVSASSKTNTSARILDSGNLVLEDNASGNILWESFKHPSDKFLPTMKFITNTRTKEMIKLTSWNTSSNPSTGNFSVALEVVSIPEAVIWNNNDNVHWRSGPWNGQSFIGIPEMDSVYLSGFNLVIQNQEYTFSVPQNYSVEEFGFLFLTSQGNFVQLYWNPQERDWNFNWIAIKTECDYYGTCGAFGICDPKASPICSCLKGFKPKNENEWNQGNWGAGCVRRTPFKCINNSAEGDGFLTVERVKLPYFVQWSDLGFTEDDCKQECLNNCSCNAYAYENGIRCMLWSKSDLIDIQKFESGGATLYIRLPYAELDNTNNGKDKKWISVAIAVPVTFVILIIIVISFWWKYTTRRKKLKTTSDDEGKGILDLPKEDDMNNMIEDDIKHEDLPSYGYEELAIATNNFDTNNKLGKGGFGSVYKVRRDAFIY
uniref:Bulb-type lectin domain-containing protein n=1 Tax=Cucumis sativus TaxID=3659 RepID=A0A0A0LXA0_CUCSA